MDEEKIELVIAAKNNDKQALEKLIKKEKSNIFATLYYLNHKDNADINDISQEVLLKLSKKIYQLKNPKNFKMWLNQIVINTYYDYLRKHKKSNFISKVNDVDDDVFNKIADYTTNPQDSILSNEMDYIIKTSIENLPLRYKLPIALREIQGLSYDEISQITKSSIGTVKSRIARARAIIRKDINNYSKG